MSCRRDVLFWGGAVVVLVVTLFPFLWGLRTSFAGRLDYQFVPRTWTLEHYRQLLVRPEFFVYLRNSLVVSAGSIAITLVASLLGGYALARFRFRGQGIGVVLMVLPLLPPVAVLVPLIAYFNVLGLYNTLAAVVMANVVFNLPFTVWMLRNFIAANPVETEEAAMLDGCSRLGLLFRVAIPMAAPGMVAVAVFVFINSWNNYLYAFALTSSQHLRVLPQGILSFLGSWGTYWGGLSAAGMIALLPPVTLFFFFQKWFVAGVVGQQLK
ncbi:MAG: carbohydrate ABC transporter permease [candidate division KSB1 bacterium]|nr:carbohydrate ABC transporter permease [candidate division KSB1 bacterium]MDZ7295238.1 carbohydrate ABC transporter permease [candidate division KSB1 bacterium]MDZ7338980.1 carbohydrate ABC transporter permease [candidate division KSB1 bacterium]MDZ7384955.1 carbohydrate ABC transporter permease [candidate division KSB1 bacterium]MDZ7391878.1 carbohydrate ABC transporter permease [candidate division KSB1 bacterium]